MAEIVEKTLVTGNNKITSNIGYSDHTSLLLI